MAPRPPARSGVRRRCPLAPGASSADDDGTARRAGGAGPPRHRGSPHDRGTHGPERRPRCRVALAAWATYNPGRVPGEPRAPSVLPLLFPPGSARHRPGGRGRIARHARRARSGFRPTLAPPLAVLTASHARPATGPLTRLPELTPPLISGRSHFAARRPCPPWARSACARQRDRRSCCLGRPMPAPRVAGSPALGWQCCLRPYQA